MKRSLTEIMTKVKSEALILRDNAAYGGFHGDGGASNMESELEFFVAGYRYAISAYVSYIEENDDFALGSLPHDYPIDVPNKWQKYFIEEDKEYQQYLELKEKFKHIN
jgi:hypothetical protein